MITIRSIRKKLTQLKSTRRVRKMFLQEEILTDIVDFLEYRLGSDPEISEFTEAMGEENKSDREELEELERSL